MSASQQRATCWSVTINNPTKSDEEWIAQARQKGWKVYGQLEQGEKGTPHYQLMVTTPQIRFSAVKKQFPRAHIEIARDRTALSKYVEKEDTRISTLPTSQEAYPTHSKIMAWYGEEFTRYGDEHFGVDDREYLKIFDMMIDRKIREGYYVESFAVNPQIRSSILKFGRAINFREMVRRQTDRQTAHNIVPDIDINGPTQSFSEEDSQNDGDITPFSSESSSQSSSTVISGRSI